MVGFTKLYVGNLSYDTTEWDLLNAFLPLGKVKAAHLNVSKETGFSTGYGFVEFFDPVECERARDLMDGAELGHRAIRVNAAIEKPRKRAS